MLLQESALHAFLWPNNIPLPWIDHLYKGLSARIQDGNGLVVGASQLVVLPLCLFLLCDSWGLSL